MGKEAGAFGAGAIFGAAAVSKSRRRTVPRTRKLLDNLSPSQTRVAAAFGQFVGNAAAAVFLGYEVYTYFSVFR
jgi:hypothetical protein